MMIFFVCGCPMENLKLKGSILLENIDVNLSEEITEIPLNETLPFTFLGNIDKEKYKSAEIEINLHFTDENGLYEKRTTKFESNDFDSIKNNKCLLKINPEDFDCINKTVSIKLTAKGKYDIQCIFIAYSEIEGIADGYMQKIFHVDVK